MTAQLSAAIQRMYCIGKPAKAEAKLKEIFEFAKAL